MTPLLLHLLLLLLYASPAFSGGTGAHLRLSLHRLHPPAGTSRLDRLRAMFQSDRQRQRVISGQIWRRRRGRRTCESSPAPAPAIEMPVWSAAYTGAGQYFVMVRLGTPAQPFLLIPDTGSDLTWVTCRYRRGPASQAGGVKKGSGHRQRRPTRVFEADLSRSFRTITCSSELCRKQLPFSLTTCPSPATPCAYDYEYGDGSSAQGFFANESATVELTDRRRMKLKGLVVGCTSSAVGTSFASSDGVLALGYANNTFVSRVAARFGPRFSYCLVDHLSPRNATGYLTFGPNPDFLPPPPAAAAAPLDLNPRLQPFYYAGIEGLSVAGEVLSIPPSVWNESRRGGAILDSGTTLTVLAEPAYRAVTGALSRKLAGVPAVGLDPFEFCYNWTSPEAARAAVPELTVHFRGSARLSPPAKSYLIDVAEGVKCLGFSSTPWPGVSIIGNIMQQEHIWEFDLENQRLRFQPSNCTAIPFI